MGLIMPLTDTWLKSNYRKPYPKTTEFTDRDGMGVRVSPKGKITFQIRFWLNGKQDRIDIGSYPTLSLKDAREKTIEVNKLIANGIDPRIEAKVKKAEIINTSATFKSIFDEWCVNKLFKTKKSGVEIKRTFEIHVYPKLGDLPADKISVNQWLTLLEPLAEEKPTIADRILANTKQLYEWAIKRELCTKNPVEKISPGGDLHIEYMPKDRNLNDDEVRAVWRGLMRSRMFIRNRIFVQLCFIYGCRSGELRLTQKSHIDKEKGVWLIPVENHKNGDKTGLPLIRPLIPETIKLFDLVSTLSDSEYLFTSSVNKNQPISRGALISLPYDLTEYLYREELLAIDHWSLHDIRRTMRTNLSKITQPHVAEVMLGHVLPKIWRTYDKYDYLDEQREALTKWVERLRLIVEPYPVI